MSRPTGIKNGEGVQQRMLAFFEANPGECLTYDDMMAQFGCKRRWIQYSVKRLREQGVIEMTVIARRVEHHV